MSTFLRQAFLPLRLGCLYCAGAASVSAMVLCTANVEVVGLTKSRELFDARIALLAALDPCSATTLGSRSRPPDSSRLPSPIHSSTPHFDTRASPPALCSPHPPCNYRVVYGSLIVTMAQSGYSNPLKKFKYVVSHGHGGTLSLMCIGLSSWASKVVCRLNYPKRGT